MDHIQMLSAPINTQQIFNLHIRIYKIFGAWPPKNPGILNRLHMLLAHDINAIGLLVTFLVVIPFYSSIEGIAANLMISSVLIVIGIKTILIYYKKPKILQVFEIIKELDDRVTSKEEAAYLNHVIRECKIITKLFLVAYCSCWIFLVIVCIFTTAEKRLWPSTSLFPHEIAQHEWLYWIVFGFQVQFNLLLCFTAAASDTFGVFLCNILGGHLDVLGNKLRSLGTENINVASVVNRNDSKTGRADLQSGLISLIEIHKNCVK